MAKHVIAPGGAMPGSDHSLTDLGLLDAAPEAGFDALTRLAMRMFKTPVALISIIDEANDRQYFKSQVGLTGAWAQARQTPLSHSFCQHVKTRNAPLIVEDAPSHPLVCNNLAIRDLNVIAYLGVPITGPQGAPLGALCVIDGSPRAWTGDDVALLTDLAGCVSDEIHLRAALKTNATLIDALQTQHIRVSRYNAFRESIALAFMAPDLTVEQRFEALLTAGCRALNADTGVIARVQGATAQPIFATRADGAPTMPDPLGSRDALFAQLSRGPALLCEPNLALSDLAGRRCLFGHIPGAVLAAPLMRDGQFYGVLEFSSIAPRHAQWSQEELSMISIISMFTSAHLALYYQITALQRSETALVGALLHSRNQARVAG